METAQEIKNPYVDPRGKAPTHPKFWIVAYSHYSIDSGWFTNCSALLDSEEAVSDYVNLCIRDRDQNIRVIEIPAQVAPQA